MRGATAAQWSREACPDRCSHPQPTNHTQFRLKCKTEAGKCGRDAAAAAREAALNMSRFTKYKSAYKA